MEATDSPPHETMRLSAFDRMAGDSPYALGPGAEAAYQRWRDRKLRERPERADDLVVEVRDPCQLSASEHAAIIDRLRRCNMAIYSGPPDRSDKSVPQRVGLQLGLARLDANWLADEDGISSLTVSAAGTRGEYIPYTNRPIRWHTDGYYNLPQRALHAMLLHCAQPAASGGENRLLDHEIAYLLLRDENADFIRALSAPDTMLIPARDEDVPAEPMATAPGVARAERAGPVFSVFAGTGDLHMRYTARTRSISWRDDADTRAAVQALAQVLERAEPFVYRLRLAAGMGIVCNNVLHDRSGFTDSDQQRRLVFRARYLDRIAGTESSFRSP